MNKKCTSFQKAGSDIVSIVIDLPSMSGNIYKSEPQLYICVSHTHLDLSLSLSRLRNSSSQGIKNRATISYIKDHGITVSLIFFLLCFMFCLLVIDKMKNMGNKKRKQNNNLNVFIKHIPKSGF